MFGPFPAGRWTALEGAIETTPRGHLQVGVRYAVCQEFSDFDGHVHPVGETWVFLGHAYAPYDDGLSLFVSLDGTGEWQIRLLDDPRVECVARKLNEYLREAGDPP